MKLSVVVPVWNRSDLARACFESLRLAQQQLAMPMEVIVVDDHSSDGAASLVSTEYTEFRLIQNDRNLGFAVSANRGMAAAKGQYLLLLNSDTEIGTEAISGLMRLLDEHPGWAGVAPRLVDSKGDTQRSCMAWPRLSTAFYFGTPMERWRPDSWELQRYFLRDFDHESARDDVQAPASCWLVRREVWESLAGFDERLELFFNDVDWALRLKQSGASMPYRPEVSVMHVGGASTSERSDFVQRWQTDRLRFYRKHHGRIAGFFVKACVLWTYCDWWFRQLRAGDSEDSKLERASVSRAFRDFLLSA